LVLLGCLVLPGFCFCAGRVTTINYKLRQSTATINNLNNNNLKQKQQHTHNNQTGGAFLSPLVRSCFFWLTWFDFVFVLEASQKTTTINNKLQEINNNLQQKQQHTHNNQPVGRFSCLWFALVSFG
jgi:hypothetical protein